MGPAAWSFNRFTFFEAIDKTDGLGLRYIEAFEGQRISQESDLKMSKEISAEAMEKIRQKLASAHVTLTSVYIHSLPEGEPECRKAFEFCRKLGIETIVSEPAPESLNVPWGTGQCDVADVLREVHRLGLKPTIFAIEYEYNWDNNSPEIARSAEFFQRTVAGIAAEQADAAQPLRVGWATADITPGIIINLACPSQETENLNEISADFRHDVRAELHRRHGSELFVLPQCAPAGDLSPHPIYRQRAEQIMDLRRGLSRRKEIARRIANAVDEALPVAKADVQSSLIFRHAVARASLPEQQPAAEPFYETDPVQPIEFHVLRLGDVAVATSPFELYLDYATRIQARSPAVLTLLVQLSSGNSGYLPTTRAVKGGGYSADRFRVGPEGGQVLVEETVNTDQGPVPLNSNQRERTDRYG